MVIKSRSKHQLTHLLLFIIVTFAIYRTASLHAQVRTWKPGNHVEMQWTGDWYSITGQSATAGSPFNQVLELLKQSREKEASGQIDEAISLAERALRIAEKELGAGHSAVVICLATLGRLYEQKEDYKLAEPYYLRALAIAEKPNSGLEPFFIATLLNSIGRLSDLRGDFLRAEPLYKRALEIQEKTLGPDDVQVATTLTNLGEMYQAKGNYAQAEQLLQRALAIREKAAGTEGIFIIQSLKSLASLYETTGEYDKAGALLQRVVTKLEKLLGADNPIIAAALSDFALHFKNQGDYVKAEQLYQRAIAILEKARGPDHASLAIPLDNLANIYQSKGDYERAEALYKRALTIHGRTLRPDDPEIATTLSNLGVLYSEQRKYELAEPLLQQALAIKEKALGPMHPEVATLLSNLEVLYYDKGDYDKAEALSQHVLTIKEKALGSEHPDVAIALNNIAALKEKRGDYKSAESLYQRALSIYEKKLGPKHPDTSSLVLNLALLAAAHGEMSQAISYLTRGTDTSEYNTALILATGSEEQKSRYMSTLASETDYTISLHLRSVPNDIGAARIALTNILRRKGRALDAMTEQLASLRRRSDPEDRALLEKLEAVRSQLATLVLNGPGKQSSVPAGQVVHQTAHEASIAELEAEGQRLEAAVSARSAEFRALSQPVTIESVQAALPLDSALVEIASYHPFNADAKNRAERYGASRYAAYVLRSDGAPKWVDLGDAVAINNDVVALRQALRTPRSTNVKQVGQALFGKLMRPLLELVGNSHRLFISPDSDLNLIPFGALVDEQNRYLIENYSITYLTSGRDLLRLQVHPNSKQGPVIFANPAFDQNVDTNKQTVDLSGKGSARRSSDLREAKFSALPGTAGEAKALAGVLPDVKVFTGAQATEAALKQVSGPRILHVATHGFFLPDILQASSPQASAESNGGRGLAIASSAPGQTARGENPLLRSGLALAGVNQRQSGTGEDGVLTALEASGLDLWGTKLVVLSACETGLGQVKNGEGVYGLRRALVLAGSESQVMSLWQVSDAATRDLMAAYYRGLQAGEGRTEALRQVQLVMIKSGTARADGSSVPAPTSTSTQQRGLGIRREGKTLSEDRSHPFYWASFIQSGDWRGLDGRQ